MKTAIILGVVVILAILAIYPWLIFWATGTLFPMMQIPYDIWTVIAFYLLNFALARPVFYRKELDD